jgi:simple sugar transport system ATP-binding protein
MASLMVGRDIKPAVKDNAEITGNVVLDVQNLTVQNENKLNVVKNVSFSIRAGEIFAIAGVAGNGQVELADAICGLAKIACGKVTICGTDITKYDIRSRIECGVSYIPEDRQKFGVVMDFILQDNLALKKYYSAPFAKRKILQREQFDEFCRRMIKEFDIRSGQAGKTVIRSMSGGNQQKAIIAREIAQNSQTLVFVQPTRGLDIGAIDNIHRQILAEREKGKAILLISLELEEIMALADTIGVIYNGELLSVAKASSLTTDEVGKFMMGVRN